MHSASDQYLLDQIDVCDFVECKFVPDTYADLGPNLHLQDLGTSSGAFKTDFQVCTCFSFDSGKVQAMLHDYDVFQISTLAHALAITKF